MTYSNLKQNFLNTVMIRYRMISKFGFRPTVKDLLTLAAQTAIVLPLPNALLTRLYLFIRGFSKPTAAPGSKPVMAGI
jgi:hypothetical protein